ncbi:MAG: hypothetical protein K0Q73_5346 [Paenibacillus sp.]|nr:hypothetical protein [Paenibacillus sp.]
MDHLDWSGEERRGEEGGYADTTGCLCSARQGETMPHERSGSRGCGGLIVIPHCMDAGLPAEWGREELAAKRAGVSSMGASPFFVRCLSPPQAVGGFYAIATARVRSGNSIPSLANPALYSSSGCSPRNRFASRVVRGHTIAWPIRFLHRQWPAA